MTLPRIVRTWAKEAVIRTPLARFVLPRFAYNMNAVQLCELCALLKEASGQEGGVLEAGCFEGRTTLFLENFLTAAGRAKPYYCLDTFEGFTRGDISAEVGSRGKSPASFTGFRVNSIAWFRRTMALNRVSRVTAFKADVGSFDYAMLGQLCFALLDVDLYEPTRRALPGVWRQLVPGGVLVVDDCNEGTHIFDGARQAAVEFARSAGVSLAVRAGKLGVLRKPAQAG
jgi:SAM-dependent methyltransferase